MKVEKTAGKILFRESQQFRQTWLWVVVISSTVMPLALVAVLMFSDKGTKPMDAVIAIGIILLTSVINIILLYVIQLDTVVTDEGIYYRWKPFRKKYTFFTWDEIGTVTIKPYPYMQYGYHLRNGYGRVHVIDGKMGVLYELNNGKRMYIGTQKMNALQYVLEQMKPVIVEKRK